jgi:hypothetical protein
MLLEACLCTWLKTWVNYEVTASVVRRWLSVAAFAFCALSTTASLAQSNAPDKAMAEMLFDQGLASMRQGQYEQACAQLEQSQAVERGIGTMLYLAECYEKLGRTASAWAMFREAASAAGAESQPDRAKQGSARAARLEPLLSKLTIHVPAESRVPGLEVSRDGVAVPNAVYDLALPLDPGDHHVEARATGRVAWSIVVSLPANAAALNVYVPELAIDPQAAQQKSVGVASQSELPAAPAAALTTQASSDVPRWQRPVGLIVGGVGIVAVGAGLGLGAVAISKKNDADRACPSGKCTNMTQLNRNRSLVDQARTPAALSTGLTIGGLALLAGGIVVYFTAPSEHATQLALLPTASGASLAFGGNL